MRATPSTEPSHRRRRETAVARRCSISSSLGESACGAVRSDCQILAGDTPPARTERVPTSASSRRHSPRVRACRRTKTLDGRDRVRRRGVSPTGSETFRYIFSDLTVLGLRLLRRSAWCSHSKRPNDPLTLRYACTRCRPLLNSDIECKCNRYTVRGHL